MAIYRCFSYFTGNCGSKLLWRKTFGSELSRPSVWHEFIEYHSLRTKRFDSSAQSFTVSRNRVTRYAGNVTGNLISWKRQVTLHWRYTAVYVTERKYTFGSPSFVTNAEKMAILPFWCQFQTRRVKIWPVLCAPIAEWVAQSDFSGSANENHWLNQPLKILLRWCIGRFPARWEIKHFFRFGRFMGLITFSSSQMGVFFDFVGFWTINSLKKQSYRKQCKSMLTGTISRHIGTFGYVTFPV